MLGVQECGHERGESEGREYCQVRGVVSRCARVYGALGAPYCAQEDSGPSHDGSPSDGPPPGTEVTMVMGDGPS